MELALYHPEQGYYASGRARIGRKGDFFTNVSVGPIFGKIIAAQFLEIWEKLGGPSQFTIVEQGAHDGQFAADVLTALRGCDSLEGLSYVIVEPFLVWKKQQQEKLLSFREKISWAESIDQLDTFTGIHFSNELFDALPVHLYEFSDREWKEIFVTIDGERLSFDRRREGAPLREASVAAAQLMQKITAKLSRGVILTVDYGFTRDEYDSPQRSAGTLQVRAQHRKLSSPFEQIGLADISAHVEWTSLIGAGESAGAKLIGFADQHHFLTGILAHSPSPHSPSGEAHSARVIWESGRKGVRAAPGEGSSCNVFATADKRALQTLLHPEMLGRSFQALALGKNFTGSLNGFRFGRVLS